ncbi:glycosyltransferase, partial [Mammaliicoccus vitulinus]
IEDKITFHGRKPIEMMPIYYSNADGLIVSLKKDDIISYTLPGKVQTYMASRKPIIGSIDGEAAEVIEKSKCGLVSPAEDVQKLSESLNEFCSMNSEERKKLGDNGYNYYKQNFTKKIFMDNLIKDMEEISK